MGKNIEFETYVEIPVRVFATGYKEFKQTWNSPGEPAHIDIDDIEIIPEDLKAHILKNYEDDFIDEAEGELE